MSTIAITSPSTRLRLTARGRAVLAALAALPVVVVIAVAMLNGGAAAASRDEGVPAGSFPMVTVAAGDSLWSLADEIAPTADPREVIDAIVRLNGLTGSSIAAGQRLAVPMEYAAGL